MNRSFYLDMVSTQQLPWTHSTYRTLMRLAAEAYAAQGSGAIESIVMPILRSVHVQPPLYLYDHIDDPDPTKTLVEHRHGVLSFMSALASIVRFEGETLPTPFIEDAQYYLCQMLGLCASYKQTIGCTHIPSLGMASFHEHQYLQCLEEIFTSDDTEAVLIEQVLLLSGYMHAHMHRARWNQCLGVFQGLKSDHFWRRCVLVVEQTQLGRPLEPQDGLWPEELAFVEARLNIKLSPRLFELYRLFGRLGHIGLHSLVSPFAWLSYRDDHILDVLFEHNGPVWTIDGEGDGDPKMVALTSHQKGHNRAEIDRFEWSKLKAQSQHTLVSWVHEFIAKQTRPPNTTHRQINLFEDIRALCHRAPAVEVHKEIIYRLEYAFALFPEETLQQMLPYVLMHFEHWQDEQFDHYHQHEPWTQVLVSLVPLLVHAIQQHVIEPSPVVMAHIYKLLIIHAVDVVKCGQPPQPLGRVVPEWEQCWTLMYVEGNTKQMALTEDDFANQHQYVQVLAMSNFLHIQSQPEQWSERWAWLVEMKCNPYWRALIQRVEVDLARELEPQDGLWPEELNVIQARLPFSLPAHILVFYRLFGRLPHLFGGQIYQPFRWCHGDSPILGLYQTRDCTLWAVDCMDAGQPVVPLCCGMWLGDMDETTFDWPLHPDLQNGYFGVQRKIPFYDWIECLIREQRPPLLY